jgi:DICT domain-containing protein
MPEPVPSPIDLAGGGSDTGTDRDADRPEGPLEYAARVRSEQSYLARLGTLQRSAWERASGTRPEITSKRLLVSLSHTIEKAVMSGPIEAPTVVVALFQKLRFFDREREVYERMAAAGIHVIIGFVRGEEHAAPAGVHVVLLAEDEPLADEWTVVAVGPHAGAFLVATDQHRFDPREREPEASRVFAGRWGYSRAQANTELARLHFALGNRLDGGLSDMIGSLLAAAMPSGGDPAASAGTTGETWATTSLYYLIDRLQTTRAGSRELREQLADAQRSAAARNAASVDPRSGLTNPDFLRRWAAPAGTTTLPVGLALFDVPALGTEPLRQDERAAYHAAHQVAAALTQPLGPVDAAVRLSEREFLVVVPGSTLRHLSGICDEIGEQLELMSNGYPSVPLRARVATIVTRSRPFPLNDLHESLAHVDPDGQVSGPVDAGRTPTGDHITVSSTRLQSEGGRLGGEEITTGMPRQREGGHNGHPSVFADPYR